MPLGRRSPDVFRRPLRGRPKITFAANSSLANGARSTTLAAVRADKRTCSIGGCQNRRRRSSILPIPRPCAKGAAPIRSSGPMGCSFRMRCALRLTAAATIKVTLDRHRAKPRSKVRGRSSGSYRASPARPRHFTCRAMRARALLLPTQVPLEGRDQPVGDLPGLGSRPDNFWRDRVRAGDRSSAKNRHFKFSSQPTYRPHPMF